MTSCDSERELNNANLVKLKEGMTKDDVVEIMGDPLENEAYNKKDLWFYYTGAKWSDGNRTSDECTPLVFENDKLVGWGQDFYKQYRQKSW